MPSKQASKQQEWVTSEWTQLWLKAKPMQKCRKLQLTEWPLEAGSKNESILEDSHFKKPNFKAE